MANETVTFDLATVLSKMDARLDRIEATQSTILLNQTELKGEIKNLETKFEGRIDTLETKLEGRIDTLEAEMKTGQDGLVKRLDNIEMLIRIIISGATVAFVGGLFTFLFNQLRSTL